MLPNLLGQHRIAEFSSVQHGAAGEGQTDAFHRLVYEKHPAILQIAADAGRKVVHGLFHGDIPLSCKAGQ